MHISDTKEQMQIQARNSWCFIWPWWKTVYVLTIHV